MAQRLLTVSDVETAIEWPDRQASDELLRYRRELVRVVLDRHNRGEITDENERMYRQVRASITGLFVGDATGFMRVRVGAPIGKRLVGKGNITKSPAQKEVAAITAAISKITNCVVTVEDLDFLPLAQDSDRDD